MSQKIHEMLDKAIGNLKAAGLCRPEMIVDSPNDHRVEIEGARVLNLTSSDYLGLAKNEKVIAAGVKALESAGLGLGSPRVVSGTQKVHRDLEEALCKFFEKPAACLFSSSYDANLGFFEPLFSDQDFIFCDSYAHPSIVDGVQRTQANKVFFRRSDMADLEDQLKRSPRARFRIIVVEGVYPLDGLVGHLPEVIALAETYDALVMLHDPHGVGVLGEGGRGTAEMFGVLDKIDILSSTFGNALSGVDLGFIAGSESLIDWIKQNAKTYVYAPSAAPVLVGAAAAALKMSAGMKAERESLRANSEELSARLSRGGFNVIKSTHPIKAIVTNDAVKTQRIVDSLFEDGILVMGLCYPLVPKGFARIRMQLTAMHTERDVAQIANSFSRAIAEKKK